ncbi:MAG: SRPBCC family protein [Mucilaginibacter sp.]|uniref:SRPBCC family protein n=1 Tax=Mucilaginibacter sp. TaxID=1882438 RepID=UPI00326452AD
MKFLKILLIIIIVLVAIYYGVGACLSKTYTVTESITINKPDSAVFKTVADFKEFAKWNPWFEKEPTAASKIEGTMGAPGSSIYWNGKKIGEGKMEIISLEPSKTISEKLTFIQPYQSECTNNFSFAPDAGGTKVTWAMDGVSPNIMSRWMMMVFAGAVHDDFKHGLQNLKKQMEAN